MDHKKIYKVLFQLGARPELCGYKYIFDILDIVEKDERIIFTKTYAIVAKKRNTVPSAVERGVRHFVSTLDRNSDVFKKVFGSPKSLTNKCFIYSLITYIKYCDNTDDADITETTASND